jgi:hypothetical protein
MRLGGEMGIFKQSDKMKKFQINRVKARQRSIEEGPRPDYPEKTNPRDYWIEMNIKQHSPFGIKEDNITLFMAHNRCDSFHFKDGKIMLMGKKGLQKVGAHRALAYIAKEKITRIGKF